MIRKILGVSASILVAMLVVGVAWASGADDSSLSSSAQVEASSSSAFDDSISSTGATTQAAAGVDASTSASLAGSTSTTIDDSTSSTFDDNGGDRDDDRNDDRDDDDRSDDDSTTSTTIDDNDHGSSVSDGTFNYTVGAGGNVTVQVVAGKLLLLDVDANAGWAVEVKEARADRIEVRFENSDARAEIKVELEHGGIDIEIDSD